MSINVKEIMESTERVTVAENPRDDYDFIGTRSFDAVEAAERQVFIANAVRYLEMVKTSKNLIPIEAKRQYNVAHKALKVALEIESNATIYGE